MKKPLLLYIMAMLLLSSCNLFQKDNKNPVNNIEVKGPVVDAHTRCVHYHSEKDVIAIKMKCCGEYYPCIKCHQETAGHEVEVWPKTDFDTKAILCGMCYHEMTINTYLNSHSQCPKCGAAFNPGCSKHYHLYFEM